MTKRFLYYRSVNEWGPIDDTRDHELRSYVDGHLRHFRYQYRLGQRPQRQLQWECRPSEQAWSTFFARLNEIGVWAWQDFDIEPIVDLGHFRLQLRDGENKLDLSGCGLLPGDAAFDAAVTELCGGLNLDD